MSKQPQPGDDDPDSDVYIGRSEVAMWMRVVSSWVCILLYMWSLLAPVLMPDRCVSFLTFFAHDQRTNARVLTFIWRCLTLSAHQECY